MLTRCMPTLMVLSETVSPAPIRRDADGLVCEPSVDQIVIYLDGFDSYPTRGIRGCKPSPTSRESAPRSLAIPLFKEGAVIGLRKRSLYCQHSPNFEKCIPV